MSQAGALRRGFAVFVAVLGLAVLGLTTPEPAGALPHPGLGDRWTGVLGRVVGGPTVSGKRW